MITKAYIVKKPSIDNNKFLVRIPIFETPGLNINKKLSSNTLEATLCYTPGNLDSYQEGDCVFVTFEENEYFRPIIIGKLYIGNEEIATTYEFIDKLKVITQADLPENTSIGDLTYNDFYQLIQNQKVLEEKITNIETNPINQVPSDWNQNDTTQKDYIFNRPTLNINSDGKDINILTGDKKLVGSGDIKINYHENTIEIKNEQQALSDITNDDKTLEISKTDNAININTKVIRKVSSLPGYNEALENVIYVLDNENETRGYIYDKSAVAFKVIDNFDNNIKKIKTIDGNLNE